MKKRKKKANTDTSIFSDDPPNDDSTKKSLSAGLPPGWTRQTIIVREVHIEKLKALGFWCQIPIKDALDRILSNFFASTHIDPIPSLEKKAAENLFKTIFLKEPIPTSPTESNSLSDSTIQD